MNAWETKTLSEVCTVIAGQSPDGADFNDQRNGLPFYQGKKDFGPRFLQSPRVWTRTVTKEAQPGDILMSVRAPVGPINLTEERVCIGRGLAAIRPSRHVDRDFLFYSLLAQQTTIAGTEGAVFASINKAQIESLSIGVPPLPEQRRIVAMLDEAFAGLTTMRAIAANNIRNARKLYDSELDTFFAGQPSTVALSELAIEVTDGDHMPPPKALSGVPFITISDIDKQAGKIDFSNTFYVPETYYQNLKGNKRPKIGDILYTVTGATLGFPVLVKQQRDFCFQRHIALIRPKPTVCSEWLNYALQSKEVFRQATLGSTGAAQKTVSLKVLRALRVPKIEHEQQRAIVAILNAVSWHIAKLESIYRRKSAAIDALQRSILQTAFAGKWAMARAPDVALPGNLAKPATDNRAATAMILAFAFERHKHARRDKSFGHVKAQKILHMVEAVAGFELGRVPRKDAAGPNDMPHLTAAERWAEGNRHFEFPQVDKGYRLKPLEAFDVLLRQADAIDPATLLTIDRVIDLFIPMDRQEAELFATIHAAWNNLLIKGETPNDDAIVWEAREGWHRDKLKIERAEFVKALAAVRKSGMIPTGKGKHVGEPPQARFL